MTIKFIKNKFNKLLLFNKIKYISNSENNNKRV